MSGQVTGREKWKNGWKVRKGHNDGIADEKDFLEWTAVEKAKKCVSVCVWVYMHLCKGGYACERMDIIAGLKEFVCASRFESVSPCDCVLKRAFEGISECERTSEWEQESTNICLSVCVCVSGWVGERVWERTNTRSMTVKQTCLNQTWRKKI